MTEQELFSLFTWESLKTLSNSAFITSLVGALAGAWAGARAAQKIAERSKAKDVALSELRSTNAAIMVSFSIFTSVLSLKNQHVKPMREALQAEKRKLAEVEAKRAAGDKAQLEFQADMRKFPTIVVPIEVLRELLFHKSSATGRPLALVSVIEQSLKGLDKTIATRDRLVDAFAREVPKEIMPRLYFGLPLPNGDVDRTFPDVVEAVHSYTNDITFFSKLLCEDLMAHGARVHKASERLLGKQAPRVSQVDFTTPKAAALLPPDADYDQWLNGFKEVIVPSKKKWWRSARSSQVQAASKTEEEKV